jgi:hypothetical protein
MLPITEYGLIPYESLLGVGPIDITLGFAGRFRGRLLYFERTKCYSADPLESTLGITMCNFSGIVSF